MTDKSSDIHNRLLTSRLPVMPQLLLKLLEMCQDEDAGIDDFSKLIQQDPGIATRVLAISNSSAYARRGQNANLNQAMQLLGTDLVRTLVISESVLQVFNGFSNTGMVRLDSFWRHTLYAALAAKQIARRVAYPRLEEAYLAGLLHDVGQLALFAVAPAEYGGFISRTDDHALCSSETESFQITHTDVGAWLISRWNLDPFIADSALYHHEDPGELVAAHPLVRIIYLAHQMANHEASDMALSLAAKNCGIEEELLDDIREELEPQLEQLAEDMGLTLEKPQAGRAQDKVISAEQQLADGVQQHMLNVQARQIIEQPGDEPALLLALSRAISMIYPVSTVCILFVDDTALRVVPQQGLTERLDEVEIPLVAGGRFVRALMAGEVHWLDAAEGNVAEQQFCRLLDVPALLIVPLTQGNNRLGVVAAGFDELRRAELSGRLRFLQAFVQFGAGKIAKLRAERLAAQSQARQSGDAQHLATRKLIHEVNNPLSIIKNYMGVLETRISSFDPASEMLGIINQEIDRVGVLLQCFGERTVELACTETTLQRLIEDTVRLLRDTGYANGGIEFVVDNEEQQRA
jgi:HD-like signal output (HDOD) protein